MSKSILKDKSFLFAIRVVNLYKVITETKREFVMSKQVYRSGTAVGALIREAQNAESKLDFIHKLAIAQKECDETMYWLELLKATNFISQNEFDSISKDNLELLKMLKSSILTVKSSIKK
ncbi:four helix bundle protein [Flavobacterium sp.]|jgi:four helix bundle protein|uniref:four helix bundle protein n=1 Tax=Flavobacterium sp. TaxID=239 RepID=UPI0037BFB7B0